MSKKLTVEDCLAFILEAIERIQRYTANLSKAELELGLRLRN